MSVIKQIVSVISGHIDPSDTSTFTRYLFTLGAGIGGLAYFATKVAAFLCEKGVTTACGS